MTTQGDSKCHRSRCEGEEADESFFVCESVSKMLGHHRSVTVFTEGQHLERADLLSPQVPKAVKYPYLFKSSLRKYPDKLINTGF